MLRVLANAIKTAFPPYQFAVDTHLFYRSANFHDFLTIELVAEGYSALVPVGAKLHLNLIAYHHFYVIQTHLAGQVGQNFSAVFQPDLEFGVRKRLYDRPYNFYFLWVVQNELMPPNKWSNATQGGRPTT